MNSKHCYPDSNVLINKEGITDQAKLDEFETYTTYWRLSQIQMKPIKGDFDKKHLCEIHKHIFQDVYPFAGVFRDENISKDCFSFANALYIDAVMDDLHKELKRENYLQGLSPEDVSIRLAYYMSELNVLHPFREGNGRTYREYIRLLAQKAGYTLQWERVEKADLYDACVRSKFSSTKELEEVIYACLLEGKHNKAIS